MKVVRLVAAVLALVASGVFAAAAGACSCPAKPPAERFAAAEAAFVGTLIERREVPRDPAPYQSSGDPFVNVYRVDEVHKGEFGATVEIRTARSSATCGLDEPVGTQIGLYPRRSAEGGWGGGSCDQVSPDEMRAASGGARPPAGGDARATRGTPRRPTVTGCTAKKARPAKKARRIRRARRERRRS